MTLKTYKKAPIKLQERRAIKPGYMKVETPVTKNRLTLWDMISGAKHDFLTLLQTSTIARILIPLILISIGTYILYGQLYPEVKQRAREAAGYYDPTRTELVMGDSIQPKETYLSNPGPEYFKKLTEDAMSANVLQEDPVSKDYRGRFTLTVPSLDLHDMQVQANVESGVEEVYNTALKTALAHFEGTGLPISDVNNNIVIYGHSAGGDYYSRTNDTAAAFTKLSDIKIGDEISINMEGKEYNYRVVKTKIVKPDDISIVTGTKGKDTLTLFTCHRPGNNTHRFVAVARPV